MTNTINKSKPIKIPLTYQNNRQKVNNLYLQNIIVTTELSNIWFNTKNKDHDLNITLYPNNPDPNCLYCELDLDHSECSHK